MNRLFLVSTGQDTGGFSWRIFEAFRRQLLDWEARSMAATRTYIAYPEDLPYRRSLLLDLYAQADVIHLQNQTAGWELYDNGAGKPTILQHHGTIFREGHEFLSAQARRVGMVEIASTLDLTLLEPDVEWVPVPYQRAEMEAIRERFYQPRDGVVRIAHAPTNRVIKGTDHFMRVVKRLQQRHRVELVLIEQRSWRQCLQMKAGADIFYDQLDLGYGCNAVEAWAMGIPVVAGVRDRQVRATMLSRWSRWPFAFAQPDTLEAVLEALITSENARQEAVARGNEHFDRWHDEAVVAPLLASIYSAAPSTEPGPVAAAVVRQEQRQEARRAEREQRAARSLQRALQRKATIRAARSA